VSGEYEFVSQQKREMFCDVTGSVLRVAVGLVLLSGRYQRAVACIKYN